MDDLGLKSKVLLTENSGEIQIILYHPETDPDAYLFRPESPIEIFYFYF